MKTLIGLLAVSLPCLADDVLLKDGRRIEFKSVEDTGETYTIVTPEGGRVVVKRADVEGFAKTSPATPLTGAAVSFSRNSKVDSTDLLKKIESDKDFLSGLWNFDRVGALQCEMPKSVGGACCQIRYTPSSEEYNLTISIERIDGEDNVGVTLPVPGGRQCQFYFDVDKGKYSSILVPGGPEGHLKASTPVPGRQLITKKSRTIVFMVRRTGLVVQLDGKDLTTFRSDWSNISPLGGAQARDAFAVSALTSGIKISKMTVTTQVKKS